MPLKLVSHNVNGFDRNESFVRDSTLSLSPCIYGIQEHWLRPPSKRLAGVNKLMSLHPDLDGWGTSAMKAKMQSKILTGRPFGGTGYIWNKIISNSVKPRSEYVHERVTVVEIYTNIGSVLCINCYMPYYDTNKIDSQSDIYTDTLGFIDFVIKDNPGSNVILFGDMNCDIYSSNNRFSVSLKTFLSDSNLTCTYDLSSTFDKQSVYSRCDLKRNSFSLLDYVFVSQDLCQYVDSVEIINSPLNLSDHFPVIVSFTFDISTLSYKKNSIPPKIDWKKVTGEVRLNYVKTMEQCLDDCSVPDILHGSHICNDSSHIGKIECYYMDIMNCIKIADQQLPRFTPTVRKCYWNEELSRLKNDSIVAHEFWKLNGCPKSGPIYETKKNSHYKYKLYLRRCKIDRDQDSVDSLNTNLIDGDHNKFWRSFNYYNNDGKRPDVYVNNLRNNVDIANCFANSFENIYTTRDEFQSQVLHDKFLQMYSGYCNEHASDSLSPYFLTWHEMINVMSTLKTGKATSTFLKAEHILLGSPKLAVHIHLLFNAMIQHAYVPCEFLNGVITPLVKDTEGNHSDPNNYRGLTLGVVLSQLFENAILTKIGHLLNTDSLQFGYKKRHSCAHAIFSLRTCIDYFTERGSTVFTAFLDCSKGFDKINHNGIFIKLMQRNIPICFLNILIYWYSNLTSVVKWNNSLSRSFEVLSGVRQGGVLSPHLFAIYVDDLIVKLRKLKVGCYIGDVFIAALVYADDFCLMAPCRSSLQLLLDACVEYGKEWCITYNPKKSNIVLFGKTRNCFPLTMYEKELDIVNDYKYLGVTVVSGDKITFSNLRPLRNFRCSANTIFNAAICSSQLVSMKLLYAICVPNLTYACEVLNYSNSQFQPMNVAINDCIRKIFGQNRWESVRFLRQELGYPSLTDIFRSLARKFHQVMHLLRNSTLDFLNGLSFDDG